MATEQNKVQLPAREEFGCRDVLLAGARVTLESGILVWAYLNHPALGVAANVGLLLFEARGKIAEALDARGLFRDLD